MKYGSYLLSSEARKKEYLDLKEMSRVGRKPIEIPDGVDVELKEGGIVVKGPKGTLSRRVHPDIRVEKKEGRIVVSPESQDFQGMPKKTRALWGLTRTLIFSMVRGVKEEYEKRLEIQGVGYRANAEGNVLSLNVGFTNPVKIPIPEGITCEVQKNIILVKGPDKEKVGQFAATARAVRPVEPYKGKGIRYEGEIVRRKLGKKAAGATK